MPDTTTITSGGESVGYPRKRRRTRRSLINAGMIVMAEKGPAHVTAGEIASTAGVATGTFYNHFPTVDDLVSAIVHDLGRGIEIGRDLLEEIEHDPARRVAIGVLQLMDMAEADPVAAKAFVTLSASRPDFRARVRGIVARAIADGVAAGHFDVAGDAATNAVLGATLQSMRSRLLGETEHDEALATARLVMRLLGTDSAKIAEIVTEARVAIDDSDER